ncbi:hypothetical protein PPYR_14942 [Photinus pyralis]|uniref:Xaa-Pro aminopeptidase 1 n=1 Tax=Photinus pyralis TaxID=7054 RepID=A0A5N4A0K4_PHOPY|nr:xaa-Pro aminopeptidase 1-like [Photinus pyralis]KAB0790855.1 hypothetical protein PPYR_14942 [Photinus pyralis]
MSPKDTTYLLKHLRSIMSEGRYCSEILNAYIVPSTDSHNSEYPAECDKRRGFISGFIGSVGSAIITDNDARMWTDGRYFLQASQEMDANWTLMKEGLPSTPTQAEWLISALPPKSCIGVDSKVIGHNTWMHLQDELEAHGHKLVPVETNLVDLVWNERDRPSMVRNPIVPLELKYSGKPIKTKLSEVRDQMKKKHASVLVLTALDEIAWLLNLRGSDVDFNPVFFSFVIILPQSVAVLIDPSQDTPILHEHFKAEAPGIEITVGLYSSAWHVVKTAVEEVTDGFIWFSDHANYSLTSIVPPKRLKTEITPCALLKTIKNNTEIQGMRNAHIKDAAAVCCYFAWLEKAVETGTVTEISGANKLAQFRAQQESIMSLSFETISGVGAHGAIMHYKPEPKSDVPITKDTLYLCDSGAQFKDGTTDITRTVHMGTPTEYQKECFTRILKGQLKLARSIFPKKIKGNYLDSFAREFLWGVGLDYRHGTGHGVGSYLNVHEGPIGISYKPFPDDPGMEEGMILSNEPGYYEDGKFGIRIEDLVVVVPATPIYTHHTEFLTFETLSLVPKQTKMIDVSLLTEEEILQLNSYHQKCREVIGEVLDRQNQIEAKQWLWRETEALKTK